MLSSAIQQLRSSELPECDTISVRTNNKKVVKTAQKSASRRKPVVRTAKKVVRRPRPLHKRILLHPFSIMVVLCAGVIIAGSTLQSRAATLDVTASVPAVPPSGPATIMQPFDQQHVSEIPVTVAGTCPDASYVKLYRNSNFSGVAQCDSGNFQIQTDLSEGENSLQARVYNVTNDEGPTSPSITVFYDVVTAEPEPPASPPTTLEVANVETADYQGGAVQQASVNPTISGVAPPFSDIVVTFHSDVMTCKTKADARGWWSCTLDFNLPLGTHHVDITATTPEGKVLNFPTFQIRVVPGLPSLLKHVPALLVSSEYQFQTHYIGQPFTWSMGLTGGTPPYTVVIDWGDGSGSTLTRSDGSVFSLQHAYPEVKTYRVLVKMTDAKGAVATMQLSAVVKGQASGLASLANNGPLAGLFAQTRQYLWIVWPVYIAVVLMVFSYWLGEREVYERMFKRRKTASGRR